MSLRVQQERKERSSLGHSPYVGETRDDEVSKRNQRVHTFDDTSGRTPLPSDARRKRSHAAASRATGPTRATRPGCECEENARDAHGDAASRRSGDGVH